MKLFRKILTAALSGAVLLVCGCSNASSNANSSPNDIISYSEESSAVSAFEIPDTVNKSASPNLTYLGCREIEGSPALETYARSVNANADSLITIEHVSKDAYEARLSELINSDLSPDLTDKRDNTFPLLMSRNMYEDLTSYMDISAPQWDSFKVYIDHYTFKGSNFFYPTSVTVSPQLLAYDKMSFVQYNIPDPEKLWEKGEWTWKSFGECTEQFRTALDSVNDIYGTEIADNVFATMGGSLIQRDAAGKLSNGINSELFTGLENFFAHFSCNQENRNISAVMDSFAVFMSADESIIGKLRRSEMNIGIVPYPKCSETGKYIVKAVSDGFLVPKGAKNITGAASFINSSRIADASEDGRKFQRKQMKQLGLLRSDTEWIELIRDSDEMIPLLVDGQCLDDEANAAMNELLMALDNIYYGSYSIQSDLGVIDRDLERINAVI